jgi:hypothetical protein
MPNDPGKMTPEDQQRLQKMLEGNRVAILPKKSDAPIAGCRQCSNCYWNPSGKVCQLEPLRSQYLPAPGGGIGLKDVPAIVPPDYGCSHHDYECEVAPHRRRDVTELQIRTAREAAMPPKKTVAPGLKDG